MASKGSLISLHCGTRCTHQSLDSLWRIFWMKLALHFCINHLVRCLMDQIMSGAQSVDERWFGRCTTQGCRKHLSCCRCIWTLLADWSWFSKCWPGAIITRFLSLTLSYFHHYVSSSLYQRWWVSYSFNPFEFAEPAAGYKLHQWWWRWWTIYSSQVWVVPF